MAREGRHAERWSLRGLEQSRGKSPEPVLAAVGFRRVLPSFVLQRRVLEYWWAAVPEREQAFAGRWYPDGRNGLVIPLRGLCIVDGQPRLEAWGVATARSASQVSLEPGTVLVGIRFQPGAMAAFVNGSVSEVARGEVSGKLSQGLRALSSEMANGLPSQRTPNTSLWRRLEDILCEWPWKPSAEGALAERALATVAKQPDLAASELSRQLRASPRTLQRAMAHATGYSLRTYRWLLRVEHARLLLHHPLPLSEVAQRAGFYDQAQLQRDFFRFTGQTPGAYQRRKRLEHFPRPVDTLPNT